MCNYYILSLNACKAFQLMRSFQLTAVLKKTEYNLICKVFTEDFLIARIPQSTVLIHFH